MPISGKQILTALREMAAPSTPEEITEHIAKKRRKKPNMEKLTEEVICALTGGTTFGYIEQHNRHFFNPEDTERFIKFLELETEENEEVNLVSVASSEDYVNNFKTQPKKRKRKGSNQFNSSRKKRKLYSSTEELVAKNLSVSAKTANSAALISVNSFACEEESSDSHLKYDLAMRAEIAKAKLDIIVDEVIAKINSLNAKNNSSHGEEHNTSQISKQIDHDSSSCYTKRITNSSSDGEDYKSSVSDTKKTIPHRYYENDLRMAAVNAKREFGEIVDDIVLSLERLRSTEIIPTYYTPFQNKFTGNITLKSNLEVAIGNAKRKVSELIEDIVECFEQQNIGINHRNETLLQNNSSGRIIKHSKHSTDEYDRKITATKIRKRNGVAAGRISRVFKKRQPKKQLIVQYTGLNYLNRAFTSSMLTTHNNNSDGMKPKTTNGSEDMKSLSAKNSVGVRGKKKKLLSAASSKY